MKRLKPSSRVLFLSFVGTFWALIQPTTAGTAAPPITPDPLLPTLTLDKTSAMLKETADGSAGDLIRATCTPNNGNTYHNVRLARISPTFPCGTCFSVLPCRQGSGFCLVFSTGQGTLSAQQTPRYTVTFSCTDSDNRYVSTTADIFIEPNAPPYFDPATLKNNKNTLNVLGEISQTQGVTVPATDPENDALIYSMVVEPPTSALEIDQLSGEIRVVPGRSLLSECRNHYSAAVYVRDSYHTRRSGPVAVGLDVASIDQNQRPLLTNTQGEIRVREDEAVDNAVLSMTVVDEGDDVRNIEGAGMTYSMTAEPANAAGLFTLVANGGLLELKVAQELDYETQPQTMTLSVKVNDGYCDSETYTLLVKLVDVNEPPVLEPSSQTLQSCEGKVDIVPNWQATDEDKDDKIEFIMIEPNDKGAFTINNKTGVISTTVDYGIDADDAFKGKDLVVNTVTISDRQGETATAEVTVRFVDCNDNPPTFPQERAKRFEVKDCETAADYVVGKVDDAKDGDSEYKQNNVISYSGQGTGAKVEPSGAVVLTKAMRAGEVINFQVVATDRGQVPGPLSSFPYYVSITALECQPKDPSSSSSDSSSSASGSSSGSGSGNSGDGSVRPVITGNLNNPFSLPDIAVGDDNRGNRKNDFFDDSLGWLIPAILLGVALLALLVFLLWKYLWPALRYCCKNMAALCKRCTQKPPPPRQVTPVQQPPPPPPRQPSPPGPAFIFGFWKETYPDDDYGKTFQQPRRQEVPEASRGPERVDTNTYDVDPVLPPPPPNAQPPPSTSCTVM